MEVEIEQFIRTFFRNANEQLLNYVVLRNYEGYPKVVQKPDIGLLVSTKHQALLASIFIQTCDELCLLYTISPNRTNILSLRCFIFSENQTNSNPQFLVKIDARTYEPFKYSSIMKQIPGLNHKIFFEDTNRIKINLDGCEFFIFNKLDELIFLLKQWQRKRDLRHKEKIIELLAEVDPADESYVTLNKITTIIDKPLTKAYDITIKDIVSSRWGRFTPFLFVKSLLKSLGVWSWRFTLKLSPVFYFSGPDGAGKTTLINGTKKFLQSNGIRFKYFYTLHKIFRHIGQRVLWLHLLIIRKETPSPSFRSFVGRGGGCHDRDTGKLWRLKKRFSLIFSFFDVWLGWLLMTIYRLRGYTILVETSPYDLFEKYHMPSFPILEKLFAPVLPKPTKGFLLKAKSENIVARKPELTTKEIRNYYQKMDYILNIASCNRYIPIDTNHNIEGAISTINRNILECFKLHS